MQNAAEANDLIQNPLRHFALAHFRKCEVAAVAGEERDDIRVAIESRAFGGNVVGYDEVGILRGKLFSRVLRDMIRFRRKPHDNFLTLVSRYLRQNVSGRRAFLSQCARQYAPRRQELPNSPDHSPE